MAYGSIMHIWIVDLPYDVQALTLKELLLLCSIPYCTNWKLWKERLVMTFAFPGLDYDNAASHCSAPHGTHPDHWVRAIIALWRHWTLLGLLHALLRNAIIGHHDENWMQCVSMIMLTHRIQFWNVNAALAPTAAECYAASERKNNSRRDQAQKIHATVYAECFWQGLCKTATGHW